MWRYLKEWVKDFFLIQDVVQPYQMERAGYPHTAEFMRWAQKNCTKIPMRDRQMLFDLARGESIEGPSGHRFIRKNQREEFFKHLNHCIEVGEKNSLDLDKVHVLRLSSVALGIDLCQHDPIY